MKLNFFTILAFSGMVMASCTSNKNADGELDSNRTDTAQTTGAAGSIDTTTNDSTTKMPDTIPRDKTTN